MSDKVQYTVEKVQPEDFTSGWNVAFILTALGVSLPMLYLGSEMALTMGWQNAMFAFAISTVVLTVLCILTTLIGNRSRLSTYMLLRFSFGLYGSKLINFLIGISLLGWYSVALELLSDAISQTFKSTLGLNVPLSVIILLGSIFITVTTIYGIRILEKLANISVPILFLFLLYVVYVALSGSDDNLNSAELSAPTMSLFEGTSALVGSSILVPVLMADFSRYIYNDKQSLLAVSGIAIGAPLVWVIAAVLAINTGEVDIILIMEKFKLVLPAFILIFVSTWVTNATNLYSVALTFATLTKQSGYTRLTLLASIVGTVMALGGFSNYFIEFLNVLAVFSPSIAAIYIIDFFVIRKQDYQLDQVIDWGVPALIAWFVSSAFAFLAYKAVFSLTGAYFIDSFLIAGIIYYGLYRLFPKKSKEAL